MTNIKITYYISNKAHIKIINKEIIEAINFVEQSLLIKFKKISIFIARNKKQYEEILKIKRQPWGVTTHKKGKIYLYDPFLWKIETTNHNIDDLKSSLIHELIHTYMYQKHMTTPVWFEEGIAFKISTLNQKDKMDLFKQLIHKYPIPKILNIKQEFKILKSPLDLMFYLTFFMLISFIFETYGNNKMVDFLKSLENKNNFEIQFNKFFKISTFTLWLNFVKYTNNQYFPKIHFADNNDYYFKTAK